jgi:hypothetical protein
MTWKVAQLYWNRVCETRGFMIVTSFVSNVAAVIMFFTLIPRLYIMIEAKKDLADDSDDDDNNDDTH